MKKRFLSVMMAVVLLVSNLSGTVFATETEGEATAEQVQVVEEVQSESKSESVKSAAPIVEETKKEEPAAPAKEEKTEEPAVEEPKEEEPAAPVKEEKAEESAVEEPAEILEEVEKDEEPEESLVEEAKTPEEAVDAVDESTEEVITDEAAEKAAEVLEEARICEEGCILESEEEHLENGGECLVWVNCTLTEGCEGPEGHEGECYGAAIYAEDGGTITVSNAKNAYVVVGSKDNIRNDTLYKTNRNGVICDLNGTEVTFDKGEYCIWYGTAGATANRWFYRGSVNVTGNSESVAVSLNRTSNSKASTASAITEDQWNFATCVYYNTSICDHIHIRVAGSYTIDIGGATYSATVSNPSLVVYVNGNKNNEKSWTGTTNYEWTYKTNISLNSEIEVHLKMNLTYRDADGIHTLEDVEVVYNNNKDRNRWIEFIAICDGIQGFDFTVSVQDIQEVIDYYKVIYQWRVYNLDGSVSDNLPESVGAHGLPSSVSGLQEDTEYVYNTGYVEGTSYYDYENGLLYTFHGWDTYSHSSEFNVNPSATGYYELDDGDADASNNKKITITADTWINGYWTVSELEPADAYLMVKKIVKVEDGDAAYVNDYLKNTGKLFISIDPGIDKDGDDAAQVDVDYPAAVSENGYRIDVYQYETPFIFNEYQAEVPGYTRSTVISTTGSNLSLVSEDTDTVNGTKAAVNIEEEYNPSQSPYNLGTVIYTNTYTKNEGAAVSEYPTLSILKSSADTNDFQSGVVFTLYSDEECTNKIGDYTTNEYGYTYVDFSGIEAGTYYLKETLANEGYVADESVYTLTLKAEEPVEERRWNADTEEYEYVQVTYYTLNVSVPETSTADYSIDVENKNYHRLHVYNSPVLGNLVVNKEIADTAGNEITDSDMLDKLDIVVNVHGPINRDAQGYITDIGDTWQLNLNSENEVPFQESLYELSYGEYLLHESFASVHGYTWEGVTYKEGNSESNLIPEEHYNNIESVLFEIKDNGQEINISLTNTYSEWEEADFYIKKVDDNGNVLSGAEFTLYTDEACSVQAADGQGYTVTATTGADGYAHFSGFTAQEEAIATFYMKETKAPAGYYLSDTVYKVKVKAVAKSAATTFETKISVKNSSGEWIEEVFDNTTDLLTVVNSPILGELTITKSLIGAPADVTEVLVQVDGPNNYSQEVVLNGTNSYSVTLEELTLGTYTIYEKDMNRPGYSLKAEYKVGEESTSTGAKVELDVENTSGSVSIINTYTKNEEFYEVPAQLTVKKVAEDGETPLAGAVFKLERLDIEGEEVISSISFTTNEEGYVIFDLLSGFITNDEPVAGTYILSEVKAPDGYEATDETWYIIVSEDDGEIRVELDADKNIFENFWDWIVGDVEGYSTNWTFADGILTVPNVRKVGFLTIIKSVYDEEEYYSDEEYTFTLDCSDDAFDKTFTLKAGDSYTVENIPWGTTYTLTEKTEGAAFVSEIKDEGNGVIEEYETRILVTNTYNYNDIHGEAALNLLKVDADDYKKVLSGAGFTLYTDEGLNNPLGTEVFSDEYGKVVIAIEAEGTYYLKETTSPEGYLENDTVYVVTAEKEYVVKNAGTSDAFTQIQMNISIEGLDEAGENTFVIENTADDKDKDDKDKDDEDDKKIIITKTPKTGDDNNLFGAGVKVIVSFLALCIAMILWFYIRRREEQN